MNVKPREYEIEHKKNRKKDDKDKQTYSFSNYNWNVQPTNAIYQDSENCSHEKNKYHFNFARTTSTMCDDDDDDDDCILCQVGGPILFLLRFSLLVCAHSLCPSLYLHIACERKVGFFMLVCFGLCLQLHAISAGSGVYSHRVAGNGLSFAAHFIMKLAHSMYEKKRERNNNNSSDIKCGISLSS